MVRLGGRQWGVPLGRVIEVLRDTVVHRVPGTGDAVAGMVNHRGRVLTVADPARALDLPGGAVGSGEVLVVEVGGHRFGLVVEAVSGLANDRRTSLEGLDLERIAEAVFT